MTLPHIIRGQRFGRLSDNYANFEDDGTLVYNGEATVFDDLQVSISNIRVPAANAPTERLYAAGVGGGVTFPFLGFTVSDYIYFDIQTVHAAKLSQIVDQHIHFCLPDTTNIGDRFQIQLDVIAAGIDGQWAVPAGSPYAAERQVIANDDAFHRLFEIANIAAVNTTISTIYKCKMTRIAATQDEYAGEVYVTFTDGHVEVDTPGGSRTEETK